MPIQAWSGLSSALVDDRGDGTFVPLAQLANGSGGAVTQIDNIRPHLSTQTLTLAGAAVQQTTAAPAGTRSVRVVARGSCWALVSGNPQPSVGTGYVIDGGTEAWLPCESGQEVGVCADTGASGTVIVHFMG